MSSLYYNKGDLILALYMYTSTGSKDNIKFYKKDHILSLEKPKHACIIILNNDTYIHVHVYIGIQCRDLHNEKKSHINNIKNMYSGIHCKYCTGSPCFTIQCICFLDSYNFPPHS